MTRKSVAAALPWVWPPGIALTLAEGEPAAPHRQKAAALRELAAQARFAARAGSEAVFPQVAEGVDGQLGIATAIFLTNLIRIPGGELSPDKQVDYAERR